MAKDNLKDLKMVMSMTIKNDESAEVIILRTLKVVDENLEEVQEWPGTDFEARDEEHELAFQAIVGSTNGLGAAYFLLQHKAQPGGAKSITKIKVWEVRMHRRRRTSLEVWRTDSIKKVSKKNSEERVLRRRADGKALLRENVIHARL